MSGRGADNLLAQPHAVKVRKTPSFTTYMWLLRNAPTSLVGTYAYVNPFVAVLLGTLILGEPLGWRTLVGGGIVIAAVAMIVRAPRPAPAPQVEPRPAAVPARGG